MRQDQADRQAVAKHQPELRQQRAPTPAAEQQADAERAVEQGPGDHRQARRPAVDAGLAEDPQAPAVTRPQAGDQGAQPDQHQGRQHQRPHQSRQAACRLRPAEQPTGQRRATIAAGLIEECRVGQVVVAHQLQHRWTQCPPASTPAKPAQRIEKRRGRHHIAAARPTLGAAQLVQQLALGQRLRTHQRNHLRPLRPAAQQGQHRADQVLDMQRLQARAIVQQGNQR